jgi:Phage tail lysozyme
MRVLEAGSAQVDAGSAHRLSSATPSATPKQTASPAPTQSAAPSASTPTLTCSGTGGVAGTGLLPLNYATIVNFLVAHGYTAMGAAGIAGNIYQESKGDPESEGTGGGGLIGWTPLPAGYVTGNAVADLQTQLSALLNYNQQWAQYIPMLNAATSPVAAADIYMNYFERPGIPAAANREGAAAAVAQACGITS